MTTAAVTYVQNTCRMFLGPIVRGELLLGLTQPVPGTSTLSTSQIQPWYECAHMAYYDGNDKTACTEENIHALLCVFHEKYVG